MTTNNNNNNNNNGTSADSGNLSSSGIQSNVGPPPQSELESTLNRGLFLTEDQVRTMEQQNKDRMDQDVDVWKSDIATKLKDVLSAVASISASLNMRATTNITGHKRRIIEEPQSVSNKSARYNEGFPENTRQNRTRDPETVERTDRFLNSLGVSDFHPGGRQAVTFAQQQTAVRLNLAMASSNVLQYTVLHRMLPVFEARTWKGAKVYIPAKVMKRIEDASPSYVTQINNQGQVVAKEAETKNFTMIEWLRTHEAIKQMIIQDQMDFRSRNNIQPSLCIYSSLRSIQREDDFDGESEGVTLYEKIRPCFQNSAVATRLGLGYESPGSGKRKSHLL